MCLISINIFVFAFIVNKHLREIEWITHPCQRYHLSHRWYLRTGKISEVGASEPGAPVLVGYSLVGVYPCAVWKPRDASSAGPVRTSSGRLASSVRTAPYPQPVYPGVEACRCARGPEEEPVPLVNGSNASGTPMLFVPYSVPSNYSSHLTPAPGPGSNSISPSGGTTPITAKVRRNTRSKTVIHPKAFLKILWLFNSRDSSIYTYHYNSCNIVIHTIIIHIIFFDCLGYYSI